MCWVDDMLKIKRMVMIEDNHTKTQSGGIRVDWDRVESYFVSLNLFGNFALQVKTKIVMTLSNMYRLWQSPTKNVG